MPATRFKRVLTAAESTWGTAVVATARRMGITDAAFKPLPVVELADELGSLAPSGISYLGSASMSGHIDGWLSYEDAPYSFDGLFAIATPGAPTGYKRDYNGPTTTEPVPRISTFEFNQAGYAYIFSGNLLTALDLSIESGKSWTFVEHYLGKWFVAGSLASVAARAVEPVLAKDTILYVDAFGGTIGTTPLNDSGIKFDLLIDNKRHLKQFTGRGVPTAWGFDQYEGTLKMTLELNATTKALLDVIAQTTPVELNRLFRFKATSGAKICQVDFAGVLENPDELFGDRDGNETLTLNFKGKTDVGGFGNWTGASVTNGVATTP